jgi:hypothetical protein
VPPRDGCGISASSIPIPIPSMPQDTYSKKSTRNTERKEYDHNSREDARQYYGSYSTDDTFFYMPDPPYHRHEIPTG